MSREPKVWCDELTPAELMLCHTIIRAEHAEEALAPFAQAAENHGLKWEPNKPDLWVSLGVQRSAWLRTMTVMSNASA